LGADFLAEAGTLVADVAAEACNVVDIRRNILPSPCCNARWHRNAHLMGSKYSP
jgi:hypothetical protein